MQRCVFGFIPVGLAVPFLLSVSSALAVSTLTSPSRANGRFPQAQVIETVPGGDGSTIYLRTTFGVLVSHDAGRSWKWICERALGYEGTWDPPIAVTRDGRLWIGLENGLASTSDGCSIERVAELEGETVADLTTDPHGETLWAITGTPEKRNAVWRRTPVRHTDAGAPMLESSNGRWERRGEVPADIHLMTIEVAPSRPSRVYLTGQPYGTVRGRLFWSDDAGKTFTQNDNALATEGPFFISAVDPVDADRVLLRHLHTTGSDVLITRDRGKTLSTVLSMPSAMFGFAKSADGKTYWAASGLAEHGIYRSTDRGLHFERISEHGVLCLHAAPGGALFVCENVFKLGTPAVAVSNDEGRTIRPLATFADVQGPITCPSTTADAAVALCTDRWSETRAAVLPRALPSSVERSPEPPDGAAIAPAPGDGAQPGAVRRSCSCHSVGAPTLVPDRVWLIAGLLPLAARGRRRTRCGSDRAQPGRPRTS